MTFSNTHNGDLRVKKNAIDGSPEGWNFQILDADRELVETITTGEDGYAASGKLEPGTYYVVEIHDRDETYWTYDAAVEKQVTVTAGTQSEVEYTNGQFGILVFCKTTNTGNQLEGWTFRVQDSDGNVVGDYTTDETGYASTGKLKPGSYTVLELSNGDDYWNCELGYHSVTIIAGKATKDAWHNREQGLGWFHKSTNTGESLEGWEITIYSDKECTQKVTTVTTNADGKVGIYLDPGIYYARETGDTEGRFENEYWLVDESIKEFEILPHKDADITFVNTQYGKIKVIKSMPSSGSLEGWTFIVRDINGDEIKGSPFVTDTSGLIVSENLYPGTYTVEEVIPDDSPYICVSENPQSVTVVQGKTAEVRFTNSLLSGKIAIRKVDTTGEPLAGAEFLLEWSVDGTSWLPVVYSNSGSKARKMLTIACAILVFLFALGITLYPLISNWYNGRHQSEIHTQYLEVLRQVDNSEIILAERYANEYNAAISPGTQLSDAFSKEALLWASEDYEDLLNLAGDGIMGYIEIPMIQVNLPIYHGTDSKTLDIGVGHLLGSSLPVGGKGTHTILTGHSGMATQKMFSDLDKLELGDVFYLQVLDETLAYRVDAIHTVLPYDTSFLGITEGEDYCTLVTCTPFGINTHRLLVRGTRIPYEEAEVITAEKLQVEDAPASTWEQQYIKGLLLGTAAVVVISVFCIWGSHFQKCRRRKRPRQREQLRPRKRGKYEKD